MQYATVKQAHIVTAGYLRGWTVGSQIGMRRPKDPTRYTINVKDAATRGPFYRRTREDGSKIDDVEYSISVAEGKAVPVLHEVEQRWPLSDEDKGLVAQFIGLQMVRGPHWYAWHSDFQQRQFEQMYAREAAKDTPDHTSVEATQQWLATDTQTHTRMLSLAPKVATVIGSMHWTLLRFATAKVATSDHPVVTWHESAVSRRHDSSMTIEGQLTAFEMRFPLSPRSALVMTWLDLPDDEAPVIEGNRQHACNLNSFTVGQAEHQWFHLPGTSPPTTTGQLLPLSPQLYDSYTAEMARASARRRGATELIQPDLGKNFPENIQILAVTRPPIIFRRATAGH